MCVASALPRRWKSPEKVARALSYGDEPDKHLTRIVSNAMFVAIVAGIFVLLYVAQL